MRPCLTWGLSCVVFLLFSINAALALVQCTVGPSGTYSTINAALAGCNGGSGSFELLLDGQFTENLLIPVTALNVTFTSLEFSIGAVPEVPYPENITTRITGFNFVAVNLSTSLFFQGVILDGGRAGEPMWFPWLTNNNLTLDRCLVSNWTGEYAIRGEPCKRSVLINIVNTRFQDVWGTTVWAEGYEDIFVDGTTLDRVGGFMNHSGMYLKSSYVTKGNFVLHNTSGWLFVDAQPRSCIFTGDVNGVTRCNRGVLECYDINATATLRPNCEQTNISYVDFNTNQTLFITEYPLACRIYRPCVCQDLVFRDTNTSSTVVLPIGDILYYTGLRLNCSAIAGDDPLYVLTDTVNITDPETNVTTTQTRGDIFVYVQSNAGLNGMGMAFPLTDPFPRGYSLYPNVYVEGEIISPYVNCSCDDTGNRTSSNFGVPCTYDVVGNNTICMDGVVRFCEHMFLECYPIDDTVVRFMQALGGVVTDTSTLSSFCLSNGSLILPNQTGSDIPCDASLTLNSTATPWKLYLLADQYACLGDLEEGTLLELETAGLNGTSASALCSTDPDLIQEGCPSIPSGPVASFFNLSCANCSDAFATMGEFVLVRACSPYQCPQVWNVTCKYSYVYPNITYVWINSDAQTFDDGRGYSGSGNLYDNGELVCPTTNPDEVAASGTFCLQELAAGRTCSVVVTGVLTSSNATLFSGGDFPYNLTADCGAPYTCTAANLTTCSCDIDKIAICFAPYTVGNDSAMFHLDNVKDELTFVDISFNRAQQLPFAMKVDRTSDAIIFNNSVLITEHTNYQGVLRELQKQSYQLEGVIHDMVGGLPSTAFNIRPYRKFCDDECPQQYVSEDEADCIVDGSIPTDQTNNFYQEIQSALDDGCKKICVRNYENFYPEDLTIDGDVEAIFSLDGACVLGSQHQLKQDNLVFRGMCWLHPGDEAKPLFVPTQDMDTLHILNCILDGGGVRGAGILPLNLKKTIKELVINDTEISLWNYAGIIAKKTNAFILSHNTFINSFGRLVDVRYENVFRINENVLINCRGTGDSKGTPLLRAVARTLGDYGRQQNDQDRSCSDEREADYGINCAFFGDVQQTPIDEDDFRDVCYSILGGAITPSDIFDNHCVKAGTGFQLRQLDSITSGTVPTLLSFNSQIRPNNFRTTAKDKDVNDWVYDEFFTSLNSPFFFVPFSTRKCDYPCGLEAARFPVCTVNPNFLVGYPGIQGETYSVYGQLSISSFGFGVFTNFTHAIYFCDIVRINPYTNGTERPIYCVGNKGGRMFRDSWSVIKDGTSFYGALLPNESYVSPECFHRCEVIGDGWFVLAENWTTANISYTMDNDTMDEGVHLISTLPSTTPVWHVNITNNTISAGNLAPYTAQYLLLLIMDIDEQTYNAQNRQRGGRRLPALNKQPNAEVIIRNNTFLVRKEFGCIDLFFCSCTF